MLVLITIDGRDAEQVAEEIEQNLDFLRTLGSLVFDWQVERLDVHTHVNPEHRSCPWRP